MIEEVNSYRFICNGCGVKQTYTPEQIPGHDAHRPIVDTRVFVRSVGWWCAETTQSINGKAGFAIRCPACGEPTAESQL